MIDDNLIDEKLLIKQASKARLEAYAPYSGFRVGAALLCEDGSIYTGCNIENSSFGLTLCAERVAIGKAVSEGHRKFLAIAIIADSDRPCSPCGACRQVIAEFGSETLVIMTNTQGNTIKSNIKELLPYTFTSQFFSQNI